MSDLMDFVDMAIAGGDAEAAHNGSLIVADALLTSLLSTKSSAVQEPWGVFESEQAENLLALGDRCASQLLTVSKSNCPRVTPPVSIVPVATASLVTTSSVVIDLTLADEDETVIGVKDELLDEFLDDSSSLKSVLRPIPGGGIWTDRFIADSTNRAVMLDRVFRKMGQLTAANARRRERMLKTNPSKLAIIFDIWDELFILEKTRQHCVADEERYRDEIFDTQLELAGDPGHDSQDEWDTVIRQFTSLWKHAINLERLYRIRLLRIQLDLLHSEVESKKQNSFNIWALKEVEQVQQDIETSFNDLTYCPEDKVVTLQDMVGMPAWLDTTQHMWTPEGRAFAKLYTKPTLTTSLDGPKFD